MNSYSGCLAGGLGGGNQPGVGSRPNSSGGLWDLTRFAKPLVRWGAYTLAHPLSQFGGALQGGVIGFQDYSQAKDYRRIADRVESAVM